MPQRRRGMAEEIPGLSTPSPANGFPQLHSLFPRKRSGGIVDVLLKLGGMKMLRAMSGLIGGCLLATAAAAQAPAQRPEIPCEAKLLITLEGAKCNQGSQMQVAVDGAAGTGRMTDGPVYFRGRIAGGEMSGVITIADKPDTGIVGMRERQVPEYVGRLTQRDRVGELSDLETLGSAWIMTYRMAGGDCAWINNYGPAQGVGNAWISQAILCRSSGSGSKPFTHDELRAAMAAVRKK